MGAYHQRGCRTLVAIVLHAAFAVAVAVGVGAESTEPALYRIFLDRGEDLVAYGDYARVGDRVVFSLPLGLDQSSRYTQLVSIPAGVVDWTTTERYTDAVRASRYAMTHGERDFARLSADVARALNEIAFSDSDDSRVALARDTRRLLLGWADTHFGYRAEDIVEIVSLLDVAIDDTERDSLSLSLVATTDQAPAVPLLPRPTPQETIARALTVSRLTPVPAERVSLLRATIAVLGDPQSGLEAGWRERTLAETRAELDVEFRTDDAYARLGKAALAEASTHSEQADVYGVQSVLDSVLEQDAELGSRRPGYLLALLTTLDVRLEDARARRLERDRWQLRAESVRAYQREVESVLQGFDAQRSMLDDIRLLAGPDAGALPTLSTSYTQAAHRLSRITPPVEVERLHGLIHQALTLAGSAARSRYQAVQDGDLHEAWDSAAAAAGAIMLFDRATEELDLALLRP
jgi:hypothetical protein